MYLSLIKPGNMRLLLVASALYGFSAMAAGPEVTLDASELVADIRDTRSVAAEVESGLQSALEVLASHTEALKAQGCTAESDSSHCRAMKSELRDAYLQLLDNVEQQLPSLRNSVQQVVTSLEARIGQKEGSTATDVQERILNSSATASNRSKPRLQGVSGSRLTQSLGKIQRLVSNAGSNRVSLEAIQADLYLDMRESLEVIEYLQADIDRTRILAEVQLGEFQISDADMSAAQDAWDILFPDSESGLSDPNQLSMPVEDDFRSPLEM